jgi:hypothetical protein
VRYDIGNGYKGWKDINISEPMHIHLNACSKSNVSYIYAQTKVLTVCKSLRKRMRATNPERIPNGSKLETASSFPNQSPGTNNQ